MCCYETNADRVVLAQGVIAPTVSNKKFSDNHAPDVMSSWFFRPNDIPDAGKVHYLPYTDGEALGTGGDGNSEIQSISSYTDDSSYKVNRKVMTFHSPEVEFDESIRTLDSSGFKIEGVGYVPVNSWAAAVYVDADSPAVTYLGLRGSGLSCQTDIRGLQVGGTSLRRGSHSVNVGEWQDTNVWYHYDGGFDPIPYPIYPFQRAGSLNDYVKYIPDWMVSYPDTDRNLWESKIGRASCRERV